MKKKYSSVVSAISSMSKLSMMRKKISILAVALMASIVYATAISPVIVHADAYGDCVSRASGEFLRTHTANDFTESVREGMERTCRTQHPASSAPASSAPASSAPASSAPASSAPASSAPASSAPASSAPASAPAGNSTIYTGPGFVNVTPFSVFGKVSVDKIINNVISYISGFLAIIAVLSIMYGGVLYMTAGGDNGKIGKAKQIIMLTGVGIVVASFSYIVVVFVTRIFYGS